MRGYPLTILVLAMMADCASAAAPEAGCKAHSFADLRALVEKDRVVEDSAAFKRVNDTMSLHALIAALGPASRDVGSGLHILIWEARDGATLRASAPGFCERVFSFKRTGAGR
jgi:hypothetical protein